MNLSPVSEISKINIFDNPEINKIYRDMIVSIQNQINIHKNKFGINYFLHPVKLVHIANIDSNLVQKILLYKLIKEIEEKGYNTAITTVSNITNIVIAWNNKIDKKELDEINQYISSKLIEDIGGFIKNC